jgi:ABC-type branched-subunit amino acid transport system substrate-binding protein
MTGVLLVFGAEATGASTSTYTLMVIAPLSSSPSYPASYPELYVGAEAAAHHIDRSGGVNGRTVKVVACDTKGDANAAVACAEQAKQQGVDAVIGALDNAGNYTAVLRAENIPNIAPYASVTVLGDPNSYPLYAGQLAYSLGILSVLAAQKNVHAVAEVYVNVGPLGAQLQSLANLLQLSYPKVMVRLVPIAPTEGDDAPVVATADQSDAVALGTSASAEVEYLQTAAQQGVKKPTSVPGSILLQGNTVTQLGSLADNLLSPVAFLPSDDTSSKAVDQFNTAMNAVDRSASKDDFAEDAYAGVELFAHTVTGLQQVSGASVAKKLDVLSGLNLGLLPPIQFRRPVTAFGPSITRVFNPDILYIQIRHGKPITNGQFVSLARAKTPSE